MRIGGHVLVPSFSMLQDFVECPYKFYNRYILHNESKPTKEMEFGKAVHEAIHRAIMQEDYSELLLQMPADAYDTARIYVQRAVNMLVDYLKDTGKVKASEMQFAVDENFNLVDFDDEKAIFRGVVDVLIEKQDLFDSSPVLWLIDWKTGSFVPSAMQLALYMYFLRKAGLNIAGGSFVFLRSQQIIDLDAEEEKLQTAVRFYNTVIQKISEALEKDSFAQNYGKHCAYCPFLHLCDIPEENIYSPEEALKKALFYEEKAKYYKEIAKEYINRTGESVEAGNFVLQKKRSVSFKITDPLKFVERVNIPQWIQEKKIEIKLKEKPESSALFEDGIISEVVSERITVRKKA